MTSDDAKARFEYISKQTHVLINERKNNIQKAEELREEIGKINTMISSLEGNRKVTQELISLYKEEQKYLKPFILDYEEWCKTLPKFVRKPRASQKP